MPEWVTVLLAIAGTLLTLGAGRVVARRYEKLGGGEAQIKLNATLKDLNDTYEDKLRERDATIAQMRIEMTECKVRLEQVEKREDRWQEERIELKQELTKVYRRLSKLEPGT